MSWLGRLFGRRRLYDDLSEEIEQHLAERTEALMAQGMSRADAASSARRQFGNVTGIQESSRDVWIWPVIDSLFLDLKFAIRQLGRDLGFTFTAVLTVALGIGASSAIFSLVDTVLLRPLPFPNQDRLMWAQQQDRSQPGVAPESLSFPDFFDWRSGNHTFSGLAAYTGGTATLGSAGEPRHLDVMTVSSNFFQVLEVAPILGRNFQPDDEKPGNRVVMLSYSLWQSVFGSASDIAGRTIKLGGIGYAVAGVMPKDFHFPLGNPSPEMWLSVAQDAEGKDSKTSQRGFDCLDLVGRLKPGVTTEQAKADLSRIAGVLAQQYPETNKWFTAALVEPELKHITGDIQTAMWVLFGAVTLVLLIACANVAGLLLARGSRRTAEIALRLSIGASRVAIVRQLLVESVILSLCGGLAGAALAEVTLRGMMRLVPLDIPRMQGAAIDGPVFLFVLVASVATGLLFGVLPAFRMSQSAPSQPMRQGSRSVVGARGQHHIHNSIVVVQTAVGLVLLVSSGLLIRSFVQILNVDPGFDPAHVSTAKLEVSFDKLNHDQHYRFYQDVAARLSALPGVQSATAGWPLPMSDTNANISFSIAGRPTAKGDEPSEPLGLAMPGYFETMRIPLLSGRTFGTQDGTNGSPVIVVNHAFVRKYFPNEDPLGKHIKVSVGDGVINRPVREVVGVVGDVRGKGLTDGPRPQYYLPYSQAVITNPFLIVRTSGNPTAVLAALREIVHEMDKTVAIYQVSTLENYISKSAAQPRFQALLLSCFAGIALLLSAVGLYGLLSYLVVHRAAEIGLRLALGARQGDILRMIVLRGLTLALLGLAQVRHENRSFEFF